MLSRLLLSLTLLLTLLGCGSDPTVQVAADPSPTDAEDQVPVVTDLPAEDPAGSTCLAGTDCGNDTPELDCEDADCGPQGPEVDGPAMEDDTAPVPATPTGDRDGVAAIDSISTLEFFADPEGNVVEVRWWSGPEPCDVFVDVDVEESNDTIAITVWQGHSMADVVCPAIAQLNSHMVRLTDTVGDRAIVNGA